MRTGRKQRVAAGQIGAAVAEALERRQLLSVSAGEYASIRSTYGSFGLPADMAGINIIEITPEQLTATDLKEAVLAAQVTTLPDLVVVRTTSTQHTITYADGSDTLVIDIPEAMGAISIVGFGARPVTLDAAGLTGVVSVGGSGGAVTANLGGMVLTKGWAAEGGGIRQYGGTLALVNVTINGNTAESGGGGLHQVDGTSTLTNVTISGNSTGGSGGGIALESSILTLTNVTISGNVAGYMGGGICQDRGTSTLTSVTISGNSAVYEGGGILASGTLALTDVIISGNKADQGGGIYQYNGTLTLANSAISGNTAIYGGGVLLSAGIAMLANVIISGNTADYGGGVCQTSGALTLTNVTISGNTAFSEGGGVYHYAGTATLANVTISGNTASYWGGGIEAFSGTIILLNTIVARNAASMGSDVSQTDTELSGANNLIGDGTGQTALVDRVDGNLVGTAANPIDPKLAEGSTFGTGLAPLPGSPVINAGDNSLIPSGISTDIYGHARIQGTKVNIGAVETVLPGMAGRIYVVSSLADNELADGVLTLREALAAANGNTAVGDAPAGSYSSADRIEFAAGLAGTILTNGRAYQIAGSMTLLGPGVDQLTLDAKQSSGVVEVRGGYDVRLSGMTLTGGDARQGGGIGAWGSRLVLDRIRISGNRAIYGGGLCQSSGASMLTNVAISGNTASETGGGIFQSSGTLSLTNGMISENVATESGGGIYRSSGTSTLTNVAISGNTASYDGGGVYQDYGTLTLANVTISGNTAKKGGGIYQNDGAVTMADVSIIGNAASGTGGGIFDSASTSTLTNVTISGNTAAESGGGVSLGLGTLTVTNATISGNTAAKSGGGVSLDMGTLTVTNTTISGNVASATGGGIDAWSGTITLSNAIVSRNTAGTSADLSQFRAELSGANNLIGDGTGQAALVDGVDGNLVGTTANPIDPGFVSMVGSDWTQWDLRLQASSPAVNAGDNAWVPSGVTTDIAGGPRISGGTVDIGAYERGAVAPTVSGSTINSGAAQRSMVKQLGVTFSEAVTLLAGAVNVVLKTGAAPNTTVNVVNPSGDGKTWVVTFSGSAVIGGSLADGVYDLVVDGAKVRGLSGSVMTGSYTQRFHRLFGDANGDRRVNLVDYRAMRMTLGKNSGQALFSDAMDYDGGAVVNAMDLSQFRRRFGRSLAY